MNKNAVKTKNEKPTTKEVNQSPMIDKLKYFYKEGEKGNFNKVYYLTKNKWGDERGINYNHTHAKCIGVKRISYFTTDVTKKKSRQFIDRIVIDADKGTYKELGTLQPIFQRLGDCERWIITGTDKTDKPFDSGSIVIMFQPIEATKSFIKGKFRTLVKCFNLNVGDALNIGYMHKNPIWETVKTFETFNYGNVTDFDTLYNTVLDFWNETEQTVTKKYKVLENSEFKKKFLDELDKEIPNPNYINAYYYRTDRSEELTKKWNEYLNKKELIPKHTQSLQEYARYLTIWYDYFKPEYHPDKIQPLTIVEKYGISEEEEDYWYNQATHDYDRYKTSIAQITGLGFNDEEIKDIEHAKCKMREKAIKTKKDKANIKINRIIELNRAKLFNKIKLYELDELKKLINYDYEKILSLRKKDNNIKQSPSCILKEGIFSYNATDKSKKLIKEAKEQLTKNFNRNIKKTYRFEKFLISKDYIIEWFLGGNVYNFSKQIKKFGITPIVEKYDKNRNKIKDTTNNNINNDIVETSNDDFFEMFKQDSANVVTGVPFYNNEGFNNIELLRLNQKLQAKEMMNDKRYQ